MNWWFRARLGVLLTKPPIQLHPWTKGVQTFWSHYVIFQFPVCDMYCRSRQKWFGKVQCILVLIDTIFVLKVQKTFHMSSAVRSNQLPVKKWVKNGIIFVIRRVSRSKGYHNLDWLLVCISSYTKFSTNTVKGRTVNWPFILCTLNVKVERNGNCIFDYLAA